MGTKPAADLNLEQWLLFLMFEIDDDEGDDDEPACPQPIVERQLPTSDSEDLEIAP